MGRCLENGVFIIPLEVALSFYETVMETNIVARKFYLRKGAGFWRGPDEKLLLQVPRSSVSFFTG